MQWLSYSLPDDSSQVWFRHTYVGRERPSKAFLSVASTGLLRVYVNGHRVTTDVLPPFSDSLCVTEMVYDVGRFLRTDSNVVAVWYSPKTASDKQLSLVYYGVDACGHRFAHRADGSWLCLKPGCYTMQDGCEGIDSRLITNREGRQPWWYATNADTTRWLHPVASLDSAVYPVLTAQPRYYAPRIVATWQGRKLATSTRDSAIYDLQRPFTGWVRVTLRGCKAGEKILVGGLTYVCNGTTDEQASRRFTLSTQRMAVITGDSRFRPSQIQSVEAVAIEPREHKSLEY